MSLDSEGRDTLATGFAAGLVGVLTATTFAGVALTAVALRVRLLRGAFAGAVAVVVGMNENSVDSFIIGPTT
tara:strand:- start:395 stop:610 length:216 start_codon:yes stop_codon:yes gene_type:complete